MNGERLQHVIEEVISRLQQRAQSSATLSVRQLREANLRFLLCQYSTLRILQVDLPLLEQIARRDSSDNTAAIIHEALAWGACIQLSVQHQLLSALPVTRLARLPLAFCDERGQPVILHPARLLSYADVARLRGETLVLSRRCVVTALAHDAASSRHIQLITQE
ncbi:microcompartment protein PduM [[Enterobacter] lignolyticus]|uniref:Microcompartment protein PduM n=1 Tax=Enterobacter lignolyticus (strain SCF1) TaxID=701347 RepID=E3G1W3_ENTLS|nr:microcompartment protein PduM [[Enterobacter] lignolyticus]ADO48006.1 hypothetical protein Entcl_1749 [[Enterobacter] lignolyticus SCF1]